jgi:cobalt-zinc-cadmium resistance protein CzcA
VASASSTSRPCAGPCAGAGRWSPPALAVLVGSGFVATRLGTEFVPKLDEGAIAMQAIRLPSVSLEESVRQMTELEKILKTFPEVTTVVSKTGRAEIATDPMGVEISDIFVMLKPHEQWTTAATREGLVEKFDELVKRSLPGQNFSYSQPIELRVAELISGVRSDVALKIYGDDLAALERIAQETVAVLSKVPGAADVKAEQTAGLPVLRVRRSTGVRSRATASTPVRCSRWSRPSAAARSASCSRDSAGLRSPCGSTRPRATRSRRSRTQGPGTVGGVDPARELADIHIEDGPAQISHESGRRRVTVELNVRGRDLGGFVADAKQAVDASGVIPAGYFTDWGGQFENLEEASNRLMIVVPLALALIFVMLFAANGSQSWRRSSI